MEDINMADADDTAQSVPLSREATSQAMSQTSSINSNISSTSNAPSSKRKRKKASMACIYCRRSHMVCSSERPCTRCIQRGIAHLCHDEPVSGSGSTNTATATTGTNTGGSTSKKAKVDTKEQQQQQKLVPVLQQQEEGQLSQQPSVHTVNTSNRVHQSLLDFQTSNINRSMDNNNGNGNGPANMSNGNNMNYLNRPMANSTSNSNSNAAAVAAAASNTSTTIQANPNNLFTADPANIAMTSSLFQQPYFFSEHAGSEFSSLNEFLSMLDDPDLNNIASGQQQQNGLQSGNNGMSNVSLSALFGQAQGSGNTSTTGATGNAGNNLPISTSHSLSNLVGTNSPNLSHLNLAGLTSLYNNNNNNNQGNTNNGFIQQQHQQQFQAPDIIPFGQHQPNAQQHQYLGPLTSSTSTATVNGHNITISDSARDKFFLTAADPSGTDSLTPEDRLKQVINAKLEAGLLQPYNYARGYARLQGYMDNYMNQSSKQRILKPLSIFRPAFRGIARSLKDVDLILVEENFERMLLDYDRVFTSMAIPACLWRRTGEIYRGNKEFASLVEVNSDDLKDGKLTIYELMSEESAVNYWEKYGDVAFDNGQKAVLTSCNLRTRDGRKRKSCCFSFTVRRDRYDIPSCIVGNFIPINP